MSSLSEPIEADHQLDGPSNDNNNNNMRFLLETTTETFGHFDFVAFLLLLHPKAT